MSKAVAVSRTVENLLRRALTALRRWQPVRAIHRRGLRRLLALPMVLLLCSSGSIGCEYTVRDIGFVDFRGREYTLLLLGPQGIAPDELEQRDAENWNVGFVAERNAQLADVPATIRDYLKQPQSPWSAWLVNADSECLMLEQSELRLTLGEVIEKHLETPLLHEIRDGALPHFAQLVLFQSSPPDQRAQQIVDESMEAIQQLSHQLPRPISVPTRQIVIQASDRQRERVFLWAAGSKKKTTVAVLAVVYGRGRLAGPVMTGEDITLNETLSQLALVGESCECETDRSWMQEVILPMSWPKSLREDAVHFLGFEPASPMVKAEMQRIVSAGPNPARLRGEAGPDNIQSLVSSYLEADISATSVSRDAVESSVSAVGPTVSAQVITGDGWSFEEEQVDVSNPGEPAIESETMDQRTAEGSASLPSLADSVSADAPLPSKPTTPNPMVWAWIAMAAVFLTTFLGSVTYVLVMKR